MRWGLKIPRWGVYFLAREEIIHLLVQHMVVAGIRHCHTVGECELDSVLPAR
jgi:hypothetical protein